MAYTKVHDPWEDTPSTATPITAAALDTIEEGIDSAWEEIDSMLAGGVAGVDYKGAYNPATAYGKGDVVLYNGVEYVAVNDSTGQTPPVVPGLGSLPVIGMGLAFPTSPFDGQEYILTDSLTAPTFSWRFRYVAAKASNKWVFVGGAPKQSVISGFMTKATLPGADLTSGPTMVVPLTGTYVAMHGANATVQVTAVTTMSVQLVGTVSGAGYAPYMVAQPQYTGGAVQGSEARSFVAGETLKIQVSLGHPNNTQFNSGWFNIVPVAVGG